jgi:aspartate/methionine/tyrosine aminotransferase
MLSGRTRWDLTPNRLDALLRAKRAKGVHVLDLTESNPTRAEIDYPPDLLEPLSRPDSLRYQPAPFGLTAAREAVAEDFARRGSPVDPSAILLTASTSEAYAFLFKLLADPGDEVLVPHPGYPLFEYLARLESVVPVPYAFAYDGEWRLDREALRRAASPRTRAVVAVHPNNPTGAFLKRDELDELRAFCRERGLALVADEVFADYPLRDDPRRAPSVAEASDVLSFALGGLSKSCGLPQLKLAWMAVTGPEALVRPTLDRLEVVADTFLSVGTPVQRALPSLLARRALLQRPIADRVGENLAALRARLLPDSPVTLLEPEGGWYAVLRIPATVPEAERALWLLEERDVLVHPGYFFDFPHEAYLVLSLLPPRRSFDEGVARVLEAVVL